MAVFIIISIKKVEKEELIALTDSGWKERIKGRAEINEKENKQTKKRNRKKAKTKADSLRRFIWLVKISSK